MPYESIKSPSTSKNVLNPSLGFVGSKARVKFNGGCLKQEKIIFNHEKVVNIYIVYEIERSFNISSYPTLENCLFGAVKLTENTLILISINILDMVLDLIRKGLIQLVMKLEEM